MIQSVTRIKSSVRPSKVRRRSFLLRQGYLIPLFDLDAGIEIGFNLDSEQRATAAVAVVLPKPFHCRRSTFCVEFGAEAPGGFTSRTCSAASNSETHGRPPFNHSLIHVLWERGGMALRGERDYQLRGHGGQSGDF